jgi:general secretion pathway protein G
MRYKSKKNAAGFTLIELVITVLIVAILGSVAIPMIQLNVKRAKETELKRHLWEIRDAIDAYKKAVDTGMIEKKINQSGYPPSLEILVDGVEIDKKENQGVLKFLRKIPIDPMLKKEEIDISNSNSLWGLRSYKSDSNQPTSGDDVFDVYSLSNEVGINGIPYARW